MSSRTVLHNRFKRIIEGNIVFLGLKEVTLVWGSCTFLFMQLTILYCILRRLVRYHAGITVIPMLHFPAHEAVSQLR